MPFPEPVTWLLDLEFIDWQGLGHRPGEQGEPPRVRVAKVWPPKDPWGKTGKVEQVKAATFPCRE